MKIEKLLIYGFGKHENITIDLGPGMNVLYGLNEAGKTTIQQFILQVLFGFPQRNSVVLRYEPKSGGRYGGQIVVRDDIYGKCVVERIRGKSAGDVTVYFEDGRKGGEEELSALLRQYNRASFESIFSFSLLQLQGFEKMGEDELSRTLLASGTTGVDSLLQLEKQMEKEMGELFKKTGRNPEMNVKIGELRELEIDLKEAREKSAEYRPAIERIYEIEADLVVSREQEKGIRAHLQQLSALRQYLPLYQKKEGLENRLKQLAPDNFPSEGIRRFESLSGNLMEAKAKQHRIKNELSDLTVRLPKMEQLERIEAIEFLLEKESDWVSWRAQVRAFDDELQRMHNLQNRLFDRLGVQMSEKDILIQADVSIRKEEEMHELINEMTTLNNKNRYLESQADDINMELREIQVDFEKVEIPTEKEITDATEWPSIRQKLAEAKAFVAFGQKQTGRGSKVLPVALLFIAIAMVGFGLIQSQWFVVIAGGIIGGIGLALYSKKESVSASEFEQMENFIATYSGKEFEMEQLIIKVSDVKLIQEQFDKTFRALELKKLKVTTEIEAYAKKVRQVETTFATFIEAYGFDGYPSPAIVPELFRMIREVQEVIRNIEEVERKKYANEQKISVRIIEVETTLQEAVPLNAMYELLRREFIKLKEEAETAKILKVEIERLQSMFKEIVVLVDTLAYDLRVLMAEANAETEEEFYNAYRIYEEKIRFEAQLEDIESQLEISGIIDLLKKRNDYELLQDTNENEAKLASLQEQSNHLITEKAELVNKRERLLTDQSYGEQRQYFEMKKAELVELAKKWSARQAVLEAIKRTILELKEKKLPEVLQHAQHMFGELTAGKYEALTISEDGYFIAVGSDGMRYSIAELSQATKEQVYIALRLALATSVFDTAPFPIMMDDPFVHFDEERLSRMIKLLHNSNQHQFIYFTCQRKMKEKWNDAVIITI